MAIDVLVVDDQELIRAGLVLTLRSEPDLRVVGEAADGMQAVEAARALAPDVVLMDIRMPVLDGIEATRRITGQQPCPSVLILTTYDADEYVFAALRSGAAGFVLKHTSPESLADAVRTVARGEGLVASAVTRRLIAEFAQTAAPRPAPPELSTLTARERDVLQLIARGRSNTEIAAELYVGAATVKTHIAHLLLKLRLRDRVQAVIYAYEHGLVRPNEPRGPAP